VRSCLVLCYSRNSPHFLQHEVPFLHSLEPATCPYLPDQSSIPLLKDHFGINIPSVPVSSKFSLSFMFPHQTLHAPHLSPISAICSTQLILLYLITKVLVSSTEQSYSLCSLLHSPLPHTLGPIFPLAPYS